MQMEMTYRVHRAGEVSWADESWMKEIGGCMEV